MRSTVVPFEAFKSDMFHVQSFIFIIGILLLQCPSNVLLQSSSYAVDDFGNRFWEEDPPITGHNSRRPIAIEVFIYLFYKLY
jgi:hypothetical protein